MRTSIFAAAALALAACAAPATPAATRLAATAAPVATTAQTAPSTAVAVATAAPTATVVVVASATSAAATRAPEPTSAPAPAKWTASTVKFNGLEQGRTDQGFYYLGNANAPVTVIEYGDFL